MQIRVFLILCISLAISACATATANMGDAADRTATRTGDIEDYRLGVGDKIRLIVYNEPTLSGEFAVGANGTMSLPLIGDVEVMGKGLAEITGAIRSRLAAGYLREPQVSGEIITYRPFFILGEVKAPGQYPYATGLTVLNAIATAQGFTPRSERKTVFIRRSGSAAEEAFTLSPELKVLPGDTIRLGERYF